MNKALIGAAMFAVLSSTSAIAQQAVPLVIAPQAQTDNVLRTGTPIGLTLSEELTTKGKNLRSGQRFRLEVAEPVMVNGMVVIPAGSPAVGEITDVRNKGMWGKSGKINARLLNVTVNGRSIRITGQFDDKGVTGTAGVIGAIAFIPVAGFFMTGTSAEVPLGARINGFIDEDVLLSMPSAPPQPMPVQAVMPVQPVQYAPAPVVMQPVAPVQPNAVVPASTETTKKKQHSRVIIDGNGM